MAAGLATRLKPVTENFPKCLLDVNGVSMLDYWMTACMHSNKFKNIYINLHHCSGQVERFLARYKAKAAKHFGEDAVSAIKTIDEIKMTNQNLLNTIIYNFCKCKYLTAKFTTVFAKGAM